MTIDQRRRALSWVERFGMEDLVTPPPSSTGPVPESANAARAAGMQDFFHLSHGQQKLVLLCRALAKQPRLLHTLSLLADDPDVAVVYVTHRQDEIDTLGFEHCLRLGASSSRRAGSE